MKNTGFVSAFVGYAIRSTTPDAAFNQNPVHMTGKNRFICVNGTCGAMPRIRKLIAALIPATSPMPTVCTARIPGKANTDVDSRAHTLRELVSIQTNRKCMIGRRRPVGG